MESEKAVLKRYFHYQSLEELAAEIKKLQLPIPLEGDPEKVKQILSRPVRVGTFSIGNSLAIHPMEGCDGTSGGRPDELTFRRYERFGRGGAKLIWFEATAVVPEGRANPRQLLLTEDNAGSFEELLTHTRRVHQEMYQDSENLLEVLQLTHSGRYSHPLPLIIQRHPVLDGLTFLDRRKSIKIPADYPVLSDDYLEQLEDHFVEAARIAKKIGFKAVDLKLTHGYLGNELLGARTRPGKYGGSLENRSRFARNVVSKIRSECGPDLLIATRLGVHDSVPFRAGFSDSVRKTQSLSASIRLWVWSFKGESTGS